ncbi:hypothetical protein F3N43_07135 [Alkalilimnicola sp. S0819]|nr:hypothetical protein F3N43_07135 [Alkalilimnicola sp. S0819]MPQ16408.1 hypothetical protein [Alkalilimnicola sp. S0819]
MFELRQALLRSIGVRVGSRARLETWTEVTFAKGDKPKKNDRPDGLLVLHTGKKVWRALIEAKIGNAELDAEQIARYVQQAKQHNIDAVITISNQFSALPSHHPVSLPKNATKGVELYHWSWMSIVTQATLLLDRDAVADEDQVFILREILRYFEHDSAGVSKFDRMNREWKDVVSKVQSGAPLAKTTDEVQNTVSCWHQEQRDVCLLISRQIGENATLKLSRVHRSDPLLRIKDDAGKLAKDKVLEFALDVPNAAADLEVVADLTKRTITCSMKLAAPGDRKSTKARANWLARQLSKANPQSLYVKATRPGRAGDTQAPLAEVLENGAALDSPNSAVVATGFEIFYLVDLAGRFAGNKVFIEQLEQAVPHFYEQVGQHLQAWAPPPPRIQRHKDAAEEAEMAEIGAATDA